MSRVGAGERVERVAHRDSVSVTESSRRYWYLNPQWIDAADGPIPVIVSTPLEMFQVSSPGE